MENIALIRSRIWHQLKHLAIDYPEDDSLTQKAIFWKGYKITLRGSHVRVKKTTKHINSSWEDISFNETELKILLNKINGL